MSFENPVGLDPAQARGLGELVMGNPALAVEFIGESRSVVTPPDE
jgi:hypothetical protein